MDKLRQLVDLLNYEIDNKEFGAKVLNRSIVLMYKHMEVIITDGEVIDLSLKELILISKKFMKDVNEAKDWEKELLKHSGSKKKLGAQLLFPLEEKSPRVSASFLVSSKAIKEFRAFCKQHHLVQSGLIQQFLEDFVKENTENS